ncbi:MAG TPA: hypothetical protein DEA22_09090, partial [Blastocatellia bacterium]|nr:hypothetical protein [Blastocatellia bacterium]
MKNNTENETKHADAVLEEKTPAAESDLTAGKSGQTSIDDLRRENNELRAKIALEAARETVIAESKKAAAISPQLIFESVKADLKFNGEGVAENAADAVERFKKRFPEQFAGKTPTGSI